MKASSITKSPKATKNDRKAPSRATALTTPVENVADPLGQWSGPFGNAYTERNRVNWRERVPFWESVMNFDPEAKPQSVFEFGCNAGWNLRAILEAAPYTTVQGVDINQKAISEAQAAGLPVQLIGQHGIAGMYPSGTVDLVFTAGVLIHLPPADLQRTMESLIDLSARYVLAIEYHADEEEAVDYQGKKGMLWRRPYGKLYQDLGLTLLSEGVAGGWPEKDVTYYLLEKAQQ